MASIIDGSTYKGYWKLTNDDNLPNAYYVVPKDTVTFTSADATSGVIKSYANAEVNLGTDANTIDENGNALNTSAKVAQYLSDNR